MKNSWRVVFYVLAGYLMLSIESPLLTSFNIRMYAPDPALAIVVYAGAVLEFLPGIVVAVSLGLLRDGFSGGVPLGMYVEIYVLVFLACVALSRRLDYKNVILMTLAVILASLASSLLFFVLSAIFDRDFEEFDMVFRLAIPQALITAPMGPIVAGILGAIDSKLLSSEGDGAFR
jgi:rod shape-determining protein MreD